MVGTSMSELALVADFTGKQVLAPLYQIVFMDHVNMNSVMTSRVRLNTTAWAATLISSFHE